MERTEYRVEGEQTINRVKRSNQLQKYGSRFRSILRFAGDGRYNRTALMGLCLWMLASSMGCGYRVASKNRLALPIRTLAVLPLSNETSTFEVEQILTRSLVQVFVRKSPYEILNDSSQADAILSGVVFRLRATPVIFKQANFGSTFLVTLSARVELLERRTQKILYRNDDHVFREQYVINVDVSNFFSELNPALDRIGEDFASSVVTEILENF